MTSQTSYDIYPGEVIIRVKFDVCTYNSFGGVKTNGRGNREDWFNDGRCPESNKVER